MDWSLAIWSAVAGLGVAPYPGHISPRAARFGWTVLAFLCLSFWTVIVVGRGEWAAVRAWGGFLAAAYVLYWQYGP